MIVMQLEQAGAEPLNSGHECLDPQTVAIDLADRSYHIAIGARCLTTR